MTETSPVKGSIIYWPRYLLPTVAQPVPDQIDMRLGNAVGGAIATYLMAELETEFG